MNTTPGDYLVYISGVEVPVKSASVTVSSAGLPVITLSMVPDPIIQDLGRGDKVPVAIFYYDVHYTASRGIAPDYRMLVEGEIAGRSVNSGPDQKSLEITAGDLAATLLHIRPNMITDLNSFADDETGVGAVSSFFGSPFAQNAVMLNSGTGASARGLMRRPYDLVQNILASMGDAAAPPQNKSVLMRLFYGKWNEKRKFSERFIPSFGIESVANEGKTPFPVMRAATSEQLVMVLKGMTEQLGDQANIWQYMQTILQSFFYTITPMLAPAMAYVNKDDEVSGAVERFGATDPGPVPEDARLRLCAYLTHPDMSFGLPPACNVVWPSMVLQHSFNEDYMSPPTRTYVGDPSVLNLTGQESGALRRVAQLALTVGYPPRAQEILKAGKDGAKVNYNDYMIYPEEYFRGPHIQSVGVPPVFFFLARSGVSDNIKNGIMPIYAEMAHHRAVAAAVSGQVVMPFNPYVAMNFPIVVLDPNDCNNHVYAKVVGITHNLSPQGSQTIVQYAMGRFLNEVAVSYMRAYIADPTTTTDIYPKEPIAEVADQFQKVGPAADYYGAMLYGATYTDRPAARVFDFKEVIGWTEDQDLRNVKNLVPEDYPTVVNSPNLVQFTLNDKYRAIGRDHAAAMRAVSRPVCRLSDYAKFMAPYGRVSPTESDRTTSTIRHFGVVPRKLLAYVSGAPDSPNYTPKLDSSGDPCQPVAADTRLNWESRLETYRQRVYRHVYNVR